MRFNVRLLRLSFVLLASVVTLYGCSQSNDSGTGRVALLLTDAPTDQFDQVNISVDSVRLIGEGPDVYLVSEPQTFNLLDLRNTSTLLANEDVPVGTYSKLRMNVSKIELVKLNANGSVAQTVIPKLPSGRINLNPQAQFTVAPGSQLTISLDINAEKSIQINTTGSEEYIVRPQVFINVVSDASSALLRMSGTALDVQADHFQLCKSGAVVVDNSCTQVNIGADTVVMDSNILVSDYSNVADGDNELVYGHLDANAQFINAVRIFDDTAALPTFSGTFTGAVSADAIDLTISKDAPGVTTGDVLPVTPLSLPATYDNHGSALDVSSIVDGATAQVIGKLQPDAITSTAIKPGLIIIETP